MSESERLKVLELLRNGQISADEAEKLLVSLGETPLTSLDDRKVIVRPKGDKATYDPELPDTKVLWLLPFGAGLGILGFFGFLMTLFSAFFAYLCLSPFILLGAWLTVIGIWSRSSHWIHVRVQERNGSNIRISLPFPVQFTSWLLAILDPVIKTKAENVELKGLGLARLVREMGDSLSPENPLMVAVDDDEDQVLVYIT